MYRAAMTFSLKPGHYDIYKEAHDGLWPEIADSMSRHQINMVIYHYQGRLFLFATAPSQEHWQRSRDDPRLEKWSTFMATMMVTDDAGKSIVESMDEAFVFGQFAESG